LQKSLGPDKAVTATSEILAKSPGKPNTVGAWESWDFNPSSGSLSYTSEKRNRFQQWLVSNPDVAAAENQDFANTPWPSDSSEKTTATLVGKAALGGNSDENAWSRAGKVPVSRNEKIQGTYAWHVSDESVKARINLYRDPSRNSTLAQKRALLAGHRPDTSRVKANGVSLDFLPNDLTSTAFAAADKTTGKVIDLDQVDLLGSSGRIKQFRNDVTPHSMGLLTDVRNGGLKQDLSSIFEFSTTASTVTLPPDFNNKKLYQSTHGITGVSDPYWSALSSYYNMFKPGWGITTPDSSPTFNQRPTQGTTITNLAPSTRFYPGPVIAKVEALFTFVTRDSHSNWVASLKAVDPEMKYMGHLVYTPLITLHNPYNINLQFDNLEVTIRNMPVAFNFYANGQAQSSGPVPLTEMFVYDTDKREKAFVMKIANWSAPASTSTTGPIIMRPGQTLVCSPYLNPLACFRDNKGTPFFDWQNNLTGTGSLPINAKPGYNGRCVGYDVDWTTPPNMAGPGAQSDGNKGVFGLRANDLVHMEYSVKQPSRIPNTAFEVTAKLTSQGRTFDYGGLSFEYQDDATLKKVLNKTYRYPTTSSFTASQAYANNDDPINKHALAKTVALFSAYARTTNGGVYETGLRAEKPGAVNALRDGRLAGKPFLFHNPARTVVKMNLRTEKPGGHSHELNFQQFVSLTSGEVEDYFILDNTNRTPALTGNSSSTGIKSGSYLELPTGPMQTIADFRRSNALTSSYLPNFVQPVGNSLVSPLMSTDKVSQTDATVAAYALLDHSVLANHALYDRFYFSTFATSGTVTPDAAFERFMTDASPLISQAFEPYLPAGKTIESAKSELFTGGKPSDAAYQKAAEYQVIRGPFNVNSTNIQAWKAVLGSMSNNDINSLIVKTANTGGLATELVTRKPGDIPILAMSLPNGENAVAGSPSAKTQDEIRSNEWNGYREITETQLEKLATEIVEQVRTRGPFLSMSEFVNRQVGSQSATTLKGALEAAISKAELNEKVVYTTQKEITLVDISNPVLYNYKTPEAATGNPAAGAPGWITQGDLMRVLEPAATVRADTFVVRVCGEAWDTTGAVTARVYAEAVVQRLPEYVDPIDRPSLNVYTAGGAAQANKKFGRRMSVVSFRWLSSKEV
jgi:hypothetical protein